MQWGDGFRRSHTASGSAFDALTAVHGGDGEAGSDTWMPESVAAAPLPGALWQGGDAFDAQGGGNGYTGKGVVVTRAHPHTSSARYAAASPGGPRSRPVHPQTQGSLSGPRVPSPGKAAAPLQERSGAPSYDSGGRRSAAPQAVTGLGAPSQGQAPASAHTHAAGSAARGQIHPGSSIPTTTPLSPPRHASSQTPSSPGWQRQQ